MNRFTTEIRNYYNYDERRFYINTPVLYSSEDYQFSNPENSSEHTEQGTPMEKEREMIEDMDVGERDDALECQGESSREQSQEDGTTVTKSPT